MRILLGSVIVMTLCTACAPLAPVRPRIPVTDAQCIVICPASYASAAHALSSFHSDTEGIPSAVVTVEELAANYAAAPNPPFNGYTDSKIGAWETITDYDFTLAKQIIAYLRDTTSHPNLQYVTLLGDRVAVPPSYWAYSQLHVQWFTSDFCYTSPDYDFVPNFKVGRLSVKNTSDAAFEVNKIINWYASANWNWFRNVYLVAGEPGVPNHFFSGEFNVLQPVNQDLLSGMHVKTLFESDGMFTKANFSHALTTPTGFMYSIAHANPDVFAFPDGDYISTRDLLNYPVNTRCPIVAAASCQSTLLSAANGAYNVGEALLKSQAGAIAYISFSGTPDGDSMIRYNQGNIEVVRFTHAIAILHNVFRSYHQGANTVGQLLFDTLSTYAATQDMVNDAHNVSVMLMATLLGDPALKIPVQQPRTEYAKAMCTAVNPLSYDASGIPVYNTASVTVAATTDSPTVKWKLMDMTPKTVLDPGTIGNTPPFEYVARRRGSRYLIRAATVSTSPGSDYSKENWMVVNVQEP